MSAASLFAAVSPFDEIVPYAWGRVPRLESHGSLLAVLAEPEVDVHRLVVYELPASPMAWGGTTPVLDVPLEGAPAAAHVSAPSQEEARVVGALEGKLVLIEQPGELFSLRPPLYARLVLREPAKLNEPEDGGVVDGGNASDDEESYRVPAELFLHHFSLVTRAADRDPLLFDETASPSLLWRRDPPCVRRRRPAPAADEGSGHLRRRRRSALGRRRALLPAPHRLGHRAHALPTADAIADPRRAQGRSVGAPRKTIEMARRGARVACSEATPAPRRATAMLCLRIPFPEAEACASFTP